MIAYWRMKISLTCSSVRVIAWPDGAVADAAPGAALHAGRLQVGSVVAYGLGILGMA